MSLSNLANASNEKRNQNIMRLQRAFNEKRVATVLSAMKYFAMTEKTILGYCRDGNIPLMDHKGNPVVKLTEENTPNWLK